MSIQFTGVHVRFTFLSFSRASALSFIILICAAFVVAPQSANANSKYAAIVIDANTGKVLHASRSNAPRYPASLTKMMTLYMVFEALDDKRISKKSRIRFSKYAASKPPSKLGIRPGRSITVETAIFSLVTKSANDVAAAVGEFLGGSEAKFAKMMTAKARQLGMKSTRFRNASGLPDSRQVTTARDMATLGLALREHFPHHYRYFSTRSFRYGKRRYGNHNRLLGRVRGVDGIKTGYTRASGYNLVTSASKGKRRIVAVVMGGRSGKSRNAAMTKLVGKYLPRASKRSRGPLVAARKSTPKFALANLPPKSAPVPKPRPAKLAVASAYAPTPKARIPERKKQKTVDPVETGATVKRERLKPSGWVVQVASLPSETEAQAFIGKTKRKAGPVLASATGFTETFEKNGTTYHRVRFGGFKSKDRAWGACSKLKKRKISCYAIAQ